MIALPPGPDFDPYCACGWDGALYPPATHQFPKGTVRFADVMNPLGRWDLSGKVVAGATGDFGEPRTELLIEKSLYGAFGVKGPGGGQYGESWADAWMTGLLAVVRDVRVVFEDNPSPSHFFGRGFNAFDLKSSLLVNVIGVNCDNFAFLRGTHSHALRCRAEAVDTDHDGLERTGLSGHYFIKHTGDLGATEDCEATVKFQHEYSVEQSDTIAMVNNRSVDGVMDEHANKEWCRNTLWYRHGVGKKSRNPFASGGNPMYLLTGFHHVNSWYVDCYSQYGFLDVTKPPAMGPGTRMWKTGAPLPGPTTTPPPAPLPPPLPGPTPTPVFPVGTVVRVVSTVYVRQSPSKTGVLLGSQGVGKLGVVLGGPVWDEANGIPYYRVDFSISPDGYVDGTKLVKL